MSHQDTQSILAGKTYFIRTFGCQMNLHDSERVSGLLDSLGCFLAADPADADIVIFMTCCVREAADQRLYGQCSSCKSLPVPPSGKRVIAVGGCIAQRDGERLLSHIDNVDVIFGTQAIAHVGELLAQAIEDDERHIDTAEGDLPAATTLPWHREQPFHAWVPIMTGCNNFCTYCIVPYVRGREKSRPFDAIVGAANMAHTVLSAYCTGCERCLARCPVDCIVMKPVSGTKTGWDAWSTEQAQTAKMRYEQRLERLQRETRQETAQSSEAKQTQKKSDILKKILARARANKTPSGTSS